MDMFFKHRLKFGIMMNIRYIKHIAIYILSVFLLSSCYISPEIEEKIELEPQPKYLGCPEDFKVYSDYENHEIALSWSGVEGATHYEVEYESAVDYLSGKEMKKYITLTPSFSLSSFSSSSDKRYIFRVRAGKNREEGILFSQYTDLLEGAMVDDYSISYVIRDGSLYFYSSSTKASSILHEGEEIVEREIVVYEGEKQLESGKRKVEPGETITLVSKLMVDGREIKEKENTIENESQEAVSRFEEELNNLKTFLKNWAKEVDKPIVIIIDELDRCRPDYAVKTLEILKHFFDISGFVFVLSIDEEQLKSSVETLFGTKNFDGYKRKFINNSFILPNPDKEKFTNFLYEKSGLANVIKHIEDSNKDLVFKVRRDNYKDFINRSFFGEDNAKEIEKCVNFNKLQTTESVIKRYFTAYSIWFKFTLRQMEQVFDRLVLFTKTIADTDMLFSPDLAVYCICLHEFDLKIYTRIKNKNSLNHNEYSLSLIAGNASSISYELYKGESFEKFAKLNRTLIPKCPEIPDFSIIDNPNHPENFIYDNVDRFFVIDRENPLKWLRDAVVDHQKNPIDNKCRIGIVAHSKAEAKWVNIEPDIDTESKFNLEQFKQTYFDKIEFISNFK